MVRYKHILLATDFSDGSDRVATKAKEFAILMNAKLSITHIVEPLPGYGYAFVGSAEIETQFIEEAKTYLANEAQKLNIDVDKQHITLGSSKIEITRIAEEIGADLIVVGSHGKYGIANLLGSTANAVIHNAKCDVLTVRMVYN